MRKSCERYGRPDVSDLQTAIRLEDIERAKALPLCDDLILEALPTDRTRPMLFLRENGLISKFVEKTYVSRYIERLVRDWNYRPIPPMFSNEARALYKATLPAWIEGADPDATPILTLNGTEFASGFTRAVIGDYGAFLEINGSQINRDVIQVQSGQEYRLREPRYAEHIKYVWMTVPDGSGIKIYWQQRTVEYADYKSGMYYVSPFEIQKGGNNHA